MTLIKQPLSFLLPLLLMVIVLALAVPAAIIQYELLRPGIDLGEPEVAKRSWENWRSLHAALTAPLLCGAITFAGLFSLIRACWLDRERIVLVALGFTLTAGLCGIATLRLMDVLSLSPPPSMIMASFLASLSAALIGAARGRRFELLVMAAPAGAAWLWGSVMLVVEANVSIDAVLLDTWYPVARTHAYGVSMILSGLTVLAAGATIAGRIHSTTINLFLVTAVSVSGVWMVLQQSAVGVNGMPRRYIDYVWAFKDAHFSAGIAAFTLLLLTLIGVVRFVFLGRRARGAEESF